MYSKTTTIKSTNSYWDNRKENLSMKINPLVEKVHRNIENADAVVIGAGAGLSASAGFTYSGKRFEDHFPDFIERYGFTDMYSAGFYPYKTFEEHWAFWSRYIFINRYQNAPKSVYNDLYNLIKNKDYFVLTTNVDHCFQKAGFDKHRLFYTQGDYGLWQCSKPCHHKTYDNEAVIKKMVAKQKNMRIPSSLIPYCPLCGLPMSMNLRADNTFVEDNGWHTAAKRYQDFLHCHKRLKILYLELGVGSNTPGIIKYPFWQMTYNNPNASYVSINLSNASIPEEISRQSVCIDHDIGDILKQLTKNT